jgi:hypothetical protein
MQLTNKPLFGIHLFHKKSPCLENFGLRVKSCLCRVFVRLALAIFARERVPLVPWRLSRGQLHEQTEQISD